MSWCRGGSRRVPRFGMAALALAACLPLLAGCGFQPLYARPDAPSSVTADLAHIKVLTIGNRIGQKLRNHLLEDLDPDGSEEPPLYTLGVGLTISKQELGLRITEEATRAKLTVAANFALNDIRTGEVPYSDRKSVV